MITIKEMAEVHAARIAERDAQIASLTAEIERLRALAIRAYVEGFGDGWGEYDEQLSEGVERDWCWERSDTRAALQPKEDAA